MQKKLSKKRRRKQKTNKHFVRFFFYPFASFCHLLSRQSDALFRFLAMFGQPFFCNSLSPLSVHSLLPRCQSNPLAKSSNPRRFPQQILLPPSLFKVFLGPLFLYLSSQMVTLLVHSLSFLLFASFAPILFCLEFCGPSLLLPGGTKACPPSSSGLKTIEGREVCCGYSSLVDGYTPEGKRTDGKGRKGKYCGPYLVVENIPRCPETHPYDETKSGKDRCCGDKPITQKQRNGSESVEIEDCADLAAPGRPSDCPGNKHRCDEPLWRDLMTEQCPKTCGRCGEKAQTMRGQQRGGTKVCRDGIGPNGQSECPANKRRCTDPIWKAFMEMECPKTCGVCWEKEGTRTMTKWRRTLTTEPTPNGR